MTAFLGYEHSPKWFNISVSYLYVLCISWPTTTSGRPRRASPPSLGVATPHDDLRTSSTCFARIPYPALCGGQGCPLVRPLRGYGVRGKEVIIFLSFFIVREKEEELLLRTGGLVDKSKKGNIIKELKYKVNNKPFAEHGLFYKKSLGKRGYCTNCSADRSIETSERLNTIIKELGLNPVYIFENLNLENTRKQILNDTEGLSGIYMIVNKTTKDYYIGSAATNRFYPRFCNHIIYFRGSKIVKLAVEKYNLENFAFIILELYPNVVTKENNKELMDLEDKYLKLLLPNYNILTEAGSSFGYKHTEVDRLKMKDIYSDARREMIGSLNMTFGSKKLSPETIEKMREKALNRPAMSAP